MKNSSASCPLPPALLDCSLFMTQIGPLYIFQSLPYRLFSVLLIPIPKSNNRLSSFILSFCNTAEPSHLLKSLPVNVTRQTCFAKNKSQYGFFPSNYFCAPLHTRLKRTLILFSAKSRSLRTNKNLIKIRSLLSCRTTVAITRIILGLNHVLSNTFYSTF